MKYKNLLLTVILTLFGVCFQTAKAQQAPVADFTLSPNPVCSGARITIQDLSSNNPTSWSYTVATTFPFPPPTVLTVQNPSITFNNQGTYIITLIASNASGSSTPVSRTITVLAGPNANINPTNANLCAGSIVQTSITVTGGGGPFGGGVNTYSWSTGSTATQIAVSPSITTIYTCVITATNGCSISRTATVNVAPSTITITSFPANICPGTTSTLQVRGSGPGPWTYTWSNSSNSNSITSNFATIVSATIQNANGCTATTNYNLSSSTTLSLTATSNPSALCAGNNASVSVVGASNYTWSNGNTTSSVIVVSPTVTTVYTVQGEIGTCSGTTSYTLLVSRIPTITVQSSPSAVCLGQSATLTANGATAYTWTPGNIFTASTVITPNASTTYTVRGVNPGCNARTTTVNLSVSPSPIITVLSSASVACIGDVVSLTAIGANSFTWSTGSNANAVIITPTASGAYTVSGTNSFGCVGAASTSLTVNECVGLKNLEMRSSAFQVYPNPAKGVVTISSTNNSTVFILNKLGQRIKTIEMTANSVTVDVSDLEVGLYFIGSTENIFLQKLIVIN